MFHKFQILHSHSGEGGVSRVPYAVHIRGVEYPVPLLGPMLLYWGPSGVNKLLL